ncbi:porin family protein [Candidatus Palauibacter sp.]|uniref:porin family protein n=1 Tax=Candidatus Palauibacter sp. TaxID=3101350 RepID=UPI003B595198
MRATRWLMGLGVATLLSTPATAAGQTAVRQTAFGIKGGVTYADAAFYDQFTSVARARTLVGAFVTLPLSDRGTIQIEALHIEKGFATTGLHEEGSTTTMSYLDFPILLRFRLTPQPSRVSPILMAGGYWGHEVACRSIGGVASFEESESCEGRFELRGVADVGLTVGGAVEVAVTGGWFVLVDARYHVGLRNLHWDPASDGSNARNWSALGGVGLRIDR